VACCLLSSNGFLANIHAWSFMLPKLNTLSTQLNFPELRERNLDVIHGSMSNRLASSNLKKTSMWSICSTTSCSSWRV